MSLYTRRRSKNAVVLGLSVAATGVGLGWLALILLSLLGAWYVFKSRSDALAGAAKTHNAVIAASTAERRRSITRRAPTQWRCVSPPFPASGLP